MSGFQLNTQSNWLFGHYFSPRSCKLFWKHHYKLQTCSLTTKLFSVSSSIGTMSLTVWQELWQSSKSFLLQIGPQKKALFCKSSWSSYLTWLWLYILPKTKYFHIHQSSKCNSIVIVCTVLETNILIQWLLIWQWGWRWTSPSIREAPENPPNIKWWQVWKSFCTITLT